MGKNLLNNNLDDFLRESYENHTIEPDRSLWEKINMRLYQKITVNNFRKFRHLKVAITSIAVVLVATFIYFEIKTQKYQPKAPLKSGTLETPASLNSNNLLSLKQNNKSQKIISGTINDTSALSSNKLFLESNENISKNITSQVNAIKENYEIPVTQKQISGLSRNFSFNNDTISKVNVVEFKMNLDSAFSSSSLALNSDSLNNHPFSLITTGIKDSSIMRTNNVTALVKTETPRDLNPLSLKFSIPFISALPFSFKPGINESVNLLTDGSTGITLVSQKHDKDTLKMHSPYQSLTQQGELSTNRTEVRRFPLFIEGFLSPEISYRALAANTEYSMPDYGKTYFNKREKADFNISTGVLGGFGITKNIILRTGIFYSTYSHKFKTEAIHLLDAGVDGNLIYTSSGPVSFKLVSSDTLSNESLIRSSLKFSYLNIPLIAELHFAHNYFINLGMNFNMLVGQNMNWQAENYDGDFSDAEAKPIKGLKSGSLSVIVGFGTEKSVFRNLSLIVNPSFKIFLSSINKTAPVKSYPYAWGLQTGLRYYFN